MIPLTRQNIQLYSDETGIYNELTKHDETLQQMAIRRKLGFFGHIMRSKGLEKEMMMACGEGRRKRGRPREKWMDEIHE